MRRKNQDKRTKREKKTMIRGRKEKKNIDKRTKREKTMIRERKEKKTRIRG